MRLAAIPRLSAVDQVVERITDVIREQKLTAGARLPGEFELVEQLRISRPVLREALARLQSLGLVTIQRGRGTFVGDVTSLASCARLLRSAVSISPQELGSYVELRAGIEVQAARLAAERATPRDIAELEAVLAELERCDLPQAESLEIDFRFHRKLIDLAGNPLMRNLIEVIYEFVVTQMARTAPRRSDRQLKKLHRAIFEAVKAGDSDAAERAMRRHMEAAFRRLVGRTPAELGVAPQA